LFTGLDWGIVSGYSKGAIFKQEVAEVDVILIVVDVLNVGYLHNSRGLDQLGII